MTGPDHHRLAEALLAKANRAEADDAPTLLAAAQVHATLALAAATAMGAAFEGDIAGFTVEEREAWYAVAGTKPIGGGSRG
ncbi:hypothetical protein [Streptomyces lavendulocolor]|uniref:hypothetical protein n=1 Tax=Streptomyces lavendulocolor TaxID=67316 RepID=UPI003C2F832B